MLVSQERGRKAPLAADTLPRPWREPQGQDLLRARAQRGLWWLSVTAVVALAEWTVVLYMASPY